jgi:hypothetical protein
MRSLSLASMVLFGGLLAGCGPYLTALTPPPPDHTAELDRQAELIELSAGVALAFRCNDINALPCEGATATTDNPQVAQVYPAHLHELSDTAYPWHHRGPKPGAGFVIVGLVPGHTVLRLRSDDGDLEYQVRVIR